MKRYNINEIYREWLKIREWEDAPATLSRRMCISLNAFKAPIKRFFFDPARLMEELNPLPVNHFKRSNKS